MCKGRLASAGYWFLQFYIQLTLDICILLFWALRPDPLAGLVPPLWHPWDHFDTLGTPCGTMGATGRTRGHPKLYFSAFEMISGTHFDSFLGSDGLDAVFLEGLFPGHFLHWFLDRNPHRRYSNKAFVLNVLQKPGLSNRRFFYDSVVVLHVFWRPSEQFYDFCCF